MDLKRLITLKAVPEGRMAGWYVVHVSSDVSVFGRYRLHWLFMFLVIMVLVFGLLSPGHSRRAFASTCAYVYCQKCKIFK